VAAAAYARLPTATSTTSSYSRYSYHSQVNLQTQQAARTKAEAAVLEAAKALFSASGVAVTLRAAAVSGGGANSFSPPTLDASLLAAIAKARFARRL
jgi:hypothetical protein